MAINVTWQSNDKQEAMDFLKQHTRIVHEMVLTNTDIRDKIERVGKVAK